MLNKPRCTDRQLFARTAVCQVQIWAARTRQHRICDWSSTVTWTKTLWSPGTQSMRYEQGSSDMTRNQGWKVRKLMQTMLNYAWAQICSNGSHSKRRLKKQRHHMSLGIHKIRTNQSDNQGAYFFGSGWSKQMDQMAHMSTSHLLRLQSDF